MSGCSKKKRESICLKFLKLNEFYITKTQTTHLNPLGSILGYVKMNKNYIKI